MAHEVRAGLDDRELRTPSRDVYVHIFAALPPRIACFAPSDNGNARKASTFSLIDFIPGLGQSVPQIVLSAIDSSLGKYPSSLAGGIPDTSRCTFGWRRTRKNAASIQIG